MEEEISGERGNKRYYFQFVGVVPGRTNREGGTGRTSARGALDGM